LTDSTRCSNDESSSSDEPPRVNMAGFMVLPLAASFDFTAGCTVMLGVLARNEDVAGEKP
jgi:hypothetical protein